MNKRVAPPADWGLTVRVSPTHVYSTPSNDKSPVGKLGRAVLDLVRADTRLGNTTPERLLLDGATVVVSIQIYKEA